MASPNPQTRTSLYPQIIHSDPHFSSPSSSQPSLYPTIDMTYQNYPSAPLQSYEELLLTIPGAIVNLIDKQYSVELAAGDLTIIRLRQGESVAAVIARISDEIQWPLAKDEASVKLDDSHYFFSFVSPKENGAQEDEILLNYGLTIASKGQDALMRELDGILDHYTSFSVEKVEEKREIEILDGSKMSPGDLKSEKKKRVMEDKCRAYWTTLAPNVEDYSGSASKMIASGSGHLVKGILFCGDVTVDRLKRGDEVLKKRISPGSKSEISPETIKRIKRVKRVTKMSQKVATGVLSGVVKVSGFFTSTIVNSKVGKKFFGLLPGEIILASLDGFSKVCDAVEVAGKNVMSTSSTVTTGLVSHRYGEEAGKATNEGLDAAGHAIGTAWAVFKIRNALNPKSAIKPTTIAKTAAKTAAAEMKAKKKSK